MEEIPTPSKKYSKAKFSLFKNIVNPIVRLESLFILESIDVLVFEKTIIDINSQILLSYNNYCERNNNSDVILFFLKILCKPINTRRKIIKRLKLLEDHDVNILDDDIHLSLIDVLTIIFYHKVSGRNLSSFEVNEIKYQLLRIFEPFLNLFHIVDRIRRKASNDIILSTNDYSKNVNNRINSLLLIIKDANEESNMIFQKSCDNLDFIFNKYFKIIFEMKTIEKSELEAIYKLQEKTTEDYNNSKLIERSDFFYYNNKLNKFAMEKYEEIKKIKRNKDQTKKLLFYLKEEYDRVEKNADIENKKELLEYRLKTLSDCGHKIDEYNKEIVLFYKSL